jgi:nitrogen fixation NifU-like protein
MTAAGKAEARAPLGALYQEMILDHYRRPRGKGELADASGTASLRNPVCGDEITVQVSGAADRVEDVCFSGRGCSISQASASMMTGLVRGRTRAEVEATVSRVRAMLEGDAVAAGDERLGDLRALAGVARFPARRRCAWMAWDALVRAMAGAR